MRAGNTYRAARRNKAKADKIKFPWPNHNLKPAKEIVAHPNKRDHSPEAEKRRAERSIVMDFTDGIAGLSRALINYTIKTIFPGKPKRHWATARRAAPFVYFFADDPKKSKVAQDRHIHPRHKRPNVART